MYTTKRTIRVCVLLVILCFGSLLMAQDIKAPRHSLRRVPGMEKGGLMTFKEIHCFGIDVVVEYLEKDGYRIESTELNPKHDPQIVAVRGKTRIFVLVRTESYPSKGRLPDEAIVRKIIQLSDSRGGRPYFASVGIANAEGKTNAEMAVPTRGAGFYVAYPGIQSIQVTSKGFDLGEPE